MADFLPEFEAMILREGGYKLHKIPGDTGGLTYAGIARNKNPHWPGWAYIDRGDIPPSQLVRDFYRAEFWSPISGDALPQRHAGLIFDFAVNAGVKTSVKLAQIIANTTPDGVMGPKSISALQAVPEELFSARFAIAKMARYAQICNRDRTQSKFLLGWLNRTLAQA